MSLASPVRALALGLCSAALFAAGCSASSSGGSGASATAAAASRSVSPSVPAAIARPSSSAATAARTSTATAGVAPPSGPGNVHETVPSRPALTRAPVALAAPAPFGDGVVARVVSARIVNAEARLPGEIAGPAVEVRVRLTNGTTHAITADNVVVDVLDARKNPLVALVTGADPLSGSVAAGATAEGTYLFHRAGDQSAPYRISVRYSADVPAVAFTGAIK